METWIVLRKLQEEKSDSQESKDVFKFMIWSLKAAEKQFPSNTKLRRMAVTFIFACIRTHIYK